MHTQRAIQRVPWPRRKIQRPLRRYAAAAAARQRPSNKTKPGTPDKKSSKDAERGARAARRAVTEGALDSRYRDAARRYTAVIVALPVAIYLTYELWRRRFLGVEQKRAPDVKEKEEEETEAR